MKEEIKNDFENKSEKITVEFFGKELAYILVNIRNSIKTIKTIERDRKERLEDIIKSPIHKEGEKELLEKIEKNLNINVPEFIEENTFVSLSPVELEQLLFEINQRISTLETNKKISPVISDLKVTAEKIKEKDMLANEELEILKIIKIKLEASRI